MGFLSKPDGRFEVLFNAFNPGASSAGKADGLPMLSGYGKVSQGTQRQDKRNAAQRGFDRVQGIFSSPYVVTVALNSFPINGINFSLGPPDKPSAVPNLSSSALATEWHTYTPRRQSIAISQI